MVRIYIAITLFVAGSAWAQAPRLDGCVAHYTGDPQQPGGIQKLLITRSPSDETRDRNLQGAGYSTTRESAIAALRDPRPDVRSLAAMKIASGGQAADIALVRDAWLAELDDCTRWAMQGAIEDASKALVFQHLGGREMFPPFQTCTPSEPAIVSLAIGVDATIRPAKILISVRNLTPGTLTLLRAVSPGYLFPVTVVDPTGGRARVAKGKEALYQPPVPPPQVLGDGPFLLPGSGSSPLGLLALKPNEEFSWPWDVASDFDMTAPGIYRVSFGGRLDFLNTTVCSNTIDVTVTK